MSKKQSAINNLKNRYRIKSESIRNLGEDNKNMQI